MTTNSSRESTSRELPMVVYRPDPILKRPSQFFSEMLLDIIKSKELAWRLFVRNISAMYRQTLLGYLWTFIPPVFTTLTFVFLNSQKIIAVEDTGMPYPVFVLAGTIFWHVFVDAVTSPLRMINKSKDMLVKINFPREALILAGVGEVLLNFLIRLVLLIGVLLWYNMSIPWSIALVPIAFFSLLVLGLLIGVFLVPFGVLFADVENGLALILVIWMFLTPVVFPLPGTGAGALLAYVNPVTPLIVSARDMITVGALSSPLGFILVSVAATLLLFISWVFCRLAVPHLIERIGV